MNNFQTEFLRKENERLSLNIIQLEKESIFAGKNAFFEKFESDLVSDNLRKSIGIITTA